jgi:hypothetical protein
MDLRLAVRNPSDEGADVSGGDGRADERRERRHQLLARVVVEDVVGRVVPIWRP